MRLRFLDIAIVTLSEGEIGELHVGLKGTMGALYIKELGEKTWRRLRGRIEAGRSGGGDSYGYDVVVNFSAAGEPERGERRIQATVPRHNRRNRRPMHCATVPLIAEVFRRVLTPRLPEETRA
jgi:site-specific DNA recombinase